MHKMTVSIDGKAYEVVVQPSSSDRSQFKVRVDGEEVNVYVPSPDDPKQTEWMIIDHSPYELVFSPALDWILSASGMHALDIRSQEGTASRPASGDGRIKAPIPGLIRRLMVEEGAKVEVGQSLLVLEAMKMENEIRSPRAGKVQQISVKPGQSVALNDLMLEVG